MVKCQNCGASCKTIIDLDKQVICNRFHKSKTSLRKEKKYPLEIVFCPSCSLVQQAYPLPTNVIFDKNFNYLSGASREAVTYFRKIAERFEKEFALKNGDTVVDIGSCDGVFLKPLWEKGINVIGVEPTPKPAAIANSQDIYTIVKEFEQTNIQDTYIKLITAFNVMAHTSTIHPFLEKVREMLLRNPSATFVNQGQYLPDIIDQLSYDTTYIEHARFYTLTSMQNIFREHSLYIYDAERTNYYGGSIIVYASIIPKKKTRRLKALLLAERKYAKFSTYENFADDVEQRSYELTMLLDELKRRSSTIVGAGAPMKSSTLLGYCNIDSNTIDVLMETNHLKIGTYSPSGIPVVSEKEYLKKNKTKIDYILILSWNWAEAIMKSIRAQGYMGSFIIPLPELKVVE